MRNKWRDKPYTEGKKYGRENNEKKRKGEEKKMRVGKGNRWRRMEEEGIAEWTMEEEEEE